MKTHGESIETSANRCFGTEAQRSMDHASAMWNPVRVFEQGIGVTANESIAFDWYGKAAKRGHLKATAALAECYFNGHGFKTGTEVALGLFSDALERGSSDAMRRLVSIYLDGVLVKKDYDIAASLYRKAADKGDPAAQFSLAVMLEKGQGIARNRDAAR
jgi:TPR repeat protein